jgi:hypothetical protein
MQYSDCHPRIKHGTLLGSRKGHLSQLRAGEQSMARFLVETDRLLLKLCNINGQGCRALLEALVKREWG